MVEKLRWKNRNGDSMGTSLPHSWKEGAVYRDVGWPGPVAQALGNRNWHRITYLYFYHGNG